MNNNSMLKRPVFWIILIILVAVIWFVYMGRQKATMTAPDQTTTPTVNTTPQPTQPTDTQPPQPQSQPQQ